MDIGLILVIVVLLVSITVTGMLTGGASTELSNYTLEKCKIKFSYPRDWESFVKPYLGSNITGELVVMDSRSVDSEKPHVPRFAIFTCDPVPPGPSPTKYDLEFLGVTANAAALKTVIPHSKVIQSEKSHVVNNFIDGSDAAVMSVLIRSEGASYQAPDILDEIFVVFNSSLLYSFEYADTVQHLGTLEGNKTRTDVLDSIRFLR